MGDYTVKKIVQITRSNHTYPYAMYAVTEDGCLYGLHTNWQTHQKNKERTWDKLPSIPSERKKKK